jgi:hypothetical protein
MNHLVEFGKRTNSPSASCPSMQQEEPIAMIEGLMNVMTPDRPVPVSGAENDGTIESVALAGAAAIQRLITDRDSFRNCASAQQRDLVALSAANEDLRRRLALIRHHYVELGTTILTQLEQFDLTMREAIRDQVTPQGAPFAPVDDANLVALAHRLKPANGSARPAHEEKSRGR